jgi:hypothetical protein
VAPIDEKPALVAARARELFAPALLHRSIARVADDTMGKPSDLLLRTLPAALVCTVALAALGSASAEGFKASSIEDFALAADGRMAIATKGGGPRPIRVAVLRPDGRLDRTFSGDGLIQPRFSRTAVQLAFDGKALLLAGSASGPPASGQVRKYDPDGSLDRSFGSPALRGAHRRTGVVNAGSGDGLLVQPGGDIVLFSGDVITRLDPRGEVLGQTFTRAGNVGVVAIGPGGGFVLSAGNEVEPFISSLLHFNPAGALVHRVFLGETPPFVPSRIALAADGHVLAVAITTQTGIVRLLGDDRTFDPAFHGDSPPCRAQESGQSPKPTFLKVLPLPDGRIVLTGSCGIVRLLPDGSTDLGFGTDGLLPIPVETRQVAVAIDGTVTFVSGKTPRGPRLTRVTAGGTIDPSFGNGGHAAVSMGY